MSSAVALSEQGMPFDWLVFDEGYGAAVPLLRFLNLVGQRFVAEVPVNFTIRATAGGSPRRADQRLTPAAAKRGRRYRLARQTVRDATWRAMAAVVWVADRPHTLLVAINEATAEVKYFLTNATAEPLDRVLAVAFRRAVVEHAFRLGKQQAGLMDCEGRDYTGLTRHLVLALAVLGFVAAHTERLRGEKPARHGRASLPSVEHPLPDGIPPPTRHARSEAHQRRHLLSPAPERASREFPQERAA
jgi:Transposase DDE domain